MNGVTVCKKNLCMSVKGPWANVVAVALVFAIMAYGIYELRRAEII